MTKPIHCKHCWKEIVVCPNHEVADWQDADETLSSFTRWACLINPKRFTFRSSNQSYSFSKKNALLVGLHEPDRSAVEAQLDAILGADESPQAGVS